LTTKRYGSFRATQSGQNQYNDQLQFEMTDSYRKSQAFMTNNETALNTISKENLTAEEKTATKSSMEVEIGKIYSNSLPIYFLYINFGQHTYDGTICRRN
jgi:hypothetical protein